MKKVILIFISMFLMGGIILAQDSNDHFSRKNAIKINPVAFGFANFQMTYERYLGDRKSSIFIAPAITLLENQQESKSGWEVMGQYRFFLTHLRSDWQRNFLGVYNYGFYTGVYGLISNYEEDFLRGVWDDQTGSYIENEYRKEVDAYEGGALIGIQMDITKRILIDFYVGGGVRHVDLINTYLDDPSLPDYYNETYGVLDPEYKGVKPKIGLLIGFSF